MTPVVTVATSVDIDQMIEVCSQNLVSNNRDKFSDEDFSKKGFLIRKLTKEDAEKMIEDRENWFCYVAKSAENVVGYLTSCDVKKSGINFSNSFPEYEKIRDEKIIYYKQIVKNPDFKGVGNAMLRKMISDVKSRGYSWIICRIVLKPLHNINSVAFHEKFGFRQVGFMEEDGATLGVFLKAVE